MAEFTGDKLKTKSRDYRTNMAVSVFASMSSEFQWTMETLAQQWAYGTMVLRGAAAY